MKTSLPVTTNRMLDRLTEAARRMPPELEAATPAFLIKTIRQRLGMTQAQVARRAGIPQSHVATIEKGRSDIRMGTLRKIATALECDCEFLLKPRHSFDELKKQQAVRIAVRRVSRVMGTMALENQEPKSTTRDDLIRSEIQRLIQHPKELWQDE